MKEVFGGSEEESSGSTKSGFQTLPKEIKDAFKKYTVDTQNMFQSGAGNNMFTPLGMTAGEQQAIDQMNAGVVPNAATLQADIAMQQNPYDQYVIDEINRQAQGENSVLQQNMAASGQYGSNRQAFGANDIDMARMDQIGRFRQENFQNAMDNALKIMPQLRQQGIQNKMEAGDFQRRLYALQQQVPYTALQAWGGLLGATPSDGGTISNQSSSGSSTGGIIPGIGSFF